MKSDTDKITVRELLKKTDRILPRFEKENNDLVNSLADIKGEINMSADKLIAAVEHGRVKLLSDKPVLQGEESQTTEGDDTRSGATRGSIRKSAAIQRDSAEQCNSL